MPFLRSRLRPLALLPLAAAAVFLGASNGLLGVCGPFSDVAADAFCPFVQEIFFLGITTGTTPTTYDPAGSVSRLQMAAFLSRSVDAVVKRGSRRAALGQFWIPRNGTVLGVTTVGAFASHPASDGADVWVPSLTDGTVSRVRASDGRLLGTWTGTTWGIAALSAMGSVFVSGRSMPGSLYRIDPRQPPGAVTTVASALGDFPFQLAFDGARIWTANVGSVSIVTPGSSIPWTVTTVLSGFASLNGALFDGANVWVTDGDNGTLLKLDASAVVLQTVPVGALPYLPIFDGANIWVPNYTSKTISVVRAGSGVVLATLTGNGLNNPSEAAFDGERVLVTNYTGDSVSVWKAADLTPIGNFLTGAFSAPFYAISDGVNFWIAFRNNQLARF